MKNRKIYIQSAGQISIQNPLCEDWMNNPVYPTEPFMRSIDPDFKKFLSPLESRRFGKILKRAIATSLKTMKECGIENPDAIITGTGLGCIENTELFLNALCTEGESLLKPTHFMQSTHNTISSLIAIQTKSHGYNATYSHKGISFDSALIDAMMQFNLGRINTALVGAHDEMTHSYFTILEKSGYVGGEMNGTCAEASVSMMLNCKNNNALCEIAGIKMLYKPTVNEVATSLRVMLQENNLSLNEIDAVMIGISGNRKNDSHYEQYAKALFHERPLLRFKHLFGECYSASALGIYAAAQCLGKGTIPAFLYCNPKQETELAPKNILVYNLAEGKNHSLILLKSSCGR
jgi:3-oxoacyl-[acyl-carrier-protein] synthase II